MSPGVALPVVGPGMPAQAQATEDQPVQKSADLERAHINTGISPDRLIVVYAGTNASPTDPARQRVRQQVGGQLLHADADIPRDVLRVPNGNAAAVARGLVQLPGVRDAYADRVISAGLSVSDPLVGQEWGLSRIGAPIAWDTSQATGVTVAVLDCGIHASHPDLLGKVTLEQNFSSSATTDDLCNHGTHVAGTIGAVTNNGVGVAAVAPRASLLDGKVLGDSGTGCLSDLDTAIQWAADNGARVINMSLGVSGPAPPGRRRQSTTPGTRAS